MPLLAGIVLLAVLVLLFWLRDRDNAHLAQQMEGEVVSLLKQYKELWWTNAEMLEFLDAMGYPNKYGALMIIRRKLRQRGMLEETWVEKDDRPRFIFRLKQAELYIETSPPTSNYLS